MQSFRTEIENPLVEQDIIELEKKIHAFKGGNVDEEKFRSLRLARGIYGQRQPGVQMIRIKLPYGKVSGEQLEKIAEVSDRYSNGNLHITTRQDIQIHYVSLDDTPQLWAELEQNEITLREACGNTVRNITASPSAGIHPDEPFDVSPYAEAVFHYFLRNPICQEMGRKIKISFSGTDEDDALSYIHDLGFIARQENGTNGFKVLVGGGLGSQARQADVVHEFLPAEKIIPFTEAVLRVFDRHGERNRRLKARLKFLVKEVGIQAFLTWVSEEQKALPYQTYPIAEKEELPTPPVLKLKKQQIPETNDFKNWKKTNVKPQKQKGLYSVAIRVNNGNFTSRVARKLAALIRNYASNELRFTLRQNMLLRHVPEEAIPFFYQALFELGLAQPGADSIHSITSCPGTDTCNLGIASSTGITRVLEHLLAEEYPTLIHQNNLSIKISGCMNSCGQHMMAGIGFQGMSMKIGDRVAPALQVLLGGENQGNGQGKFAEKVIKIPSKRGPDALRRLLNDFISQGENRAFARYYETQGKNYFFELLKPLSDIDTLTSNDFVDWGHETPYKTSIGIGECAGVTVDLVATLLLESEEKRAHAQHALQEEKWADAIYWSYAIYVNSAKALLLTQNKKTNSQAQIISAFSEWAEEIAPGVFKDFAQELYQIKNNAPSQTFAHNYARQAWNFHKKIITHRKKEHNEK